MSKLKRKVLWQTFVSLLAALWAFSWAVPIGAAENKLMAIASDAIAGFGVSLQTNVTQSQTEVTFTVTKPNGQIVRLYANTNLEGIAKIDLDSTHTTKIGVYKVTVEARNFPEALPHESTFRIFPDIVSDITSNLEISKPTIKADKQDYGYLTVTLRDKYYNAIPEHLVKIISSRANDLIDKINGGITDDQGKANFKISSADAGIATYIAIDTITGKTLLKRESVIFYAAATLSGENEQAGDLLKTSLFQTAFVGGPVAKLEIVAPKKVKVASSFDITLHILDSSDSPVPDYRGTILFSAPDDPNASLPVQTTGYTFTGAEEKPGEHAFIKAASFSTQGMHQLVVTDVDNPELEGNLIIEVVDQLTQNNPPPSPQDLTILSPKTGSTFGTGTINLIGKTFANTQVKASDNGLEVANKITDNEGNFTFALLNLANGSHKLQVKVFDAEDTEILVSPEIAITIDTEPPALQEIKVEPALEVAPGEALTLTIISEPALKDVKVTLNQKSFTLNEDTSTPGTYKVSLPAPEEPGQYPLEMMLIDSYGNQTSPTTNKTITVGSLNLPKIEQLNFESTSDSVQVSWAAPTSLGDLQSYRLTYGSSATTLNQTLTIPREQVSVTVNNLQSETTYYFQLAALNEKGREGEKSSAQSYATKKKFGFFNLKTETKESTVILSWDIGDNSRVKEYLVEYGIRSKEYPVKIYTLNNTARVEINDLIDGLRYYFMIHALDPQNTDLLQSEEVNALAGLNPQEITYNVEPAPCEPGDVKNLKLIEKETGEPKGQVGWILTWDPQVNVDYYNVYIGSRPGRYDLPTQKAETNSFVVPYVDDDKQYHYFSVKAVCADEQKESNVYSKALRINTGPALGILVGLTLLTGGIIYFYQRRKVKA